MVTKQFILTTMLTAILTSITIIYTAAESPSVERCEPTGKPLSSIALGWRSSRRQGYGPQGLSEDCLAKEYRTRAPQAKGILDKCKRPTKTRICQANRALHHALESGDLSRARQALEDGADPNMAPNSTLYFKTKRWLLDNKYMPNASYNIYIASRAFFFAYFAAAGISATPHFVYKYLCRPEQLHPGILAFSLWLPCALGAMRLGLYLGENKDVLQANCIQERQNRITLSAPPLLRHDDPDIVKMLISYNANVNIRDSYGNTALMHIINKRCRTRIEKQIKQLEQKTKILGLACTQPDLSFYKGESYIISIFKEAYDIRQKICTQLNAIKTFLNSSEWSNRSLPLDLKHIIAGYMFPSCDASDEDVKRLIEHFVWNWNEELPDDTIDEDVQWLIHHCMQQDEQLAALQKFSSIPQVIYETESLESPPAASTY